LIHEAIHRERREVDEHDLEYRLQAAERGTRREPGDRRLADRRVAHTRGAVFFRQPARHAERTARRDVLAQEMHGRVPRQFLVERLAQDLDERMLHNLKPESPRTPARRRRNP
jgi:hypothetical protein